MASLRHSTIGMRCRNGSFASRRPRIYDLVPAAMTRLGYRIRPRPHPMKGPAMEPTYTVIAVAAATLAAVLSHLRQRRFARSFRPTGRESNAEQRRAAPLE